MLAEADFDDITGTPVGPAVPAGTPGAVASNDIAAETSRAGTAPCHAGGTEMLPTNRAVPRLADIAEPKPPLLPSTCMPGAVAPASAGAPARTSVAPITEVAGTVPCASATIGDTTAAVAGYIPIWATEARDDTDTGSAENSVPTWAIADSAVPISEDSPEANVDPIDDRKSVSGVDINPAKLPGGAMIVGKAAATDDAPA